MRRSRAAGQQAAHLGQDGVGREGLGHEARGAQAPAPARASVSSPRVVTHEDGQRAQLVLPAHELDHLEAADVRHVEVEDHQVERLERERLDGLEPAAPPGRRSARASPRRQAITISRITLLSSTTRTSAIGRAPWGVTGSVEPYENGRAGLSTNDPLDNRRCAVARRTVDSAARRATYACVLSMVTGGTLAGAVWVVDDSPLDVERAERALSADYAVTTLHRGLDRASSASDRGHAPDVLVLDWVMPGADRHRGLPVPALARRPHREAGHPAADRGPRDRAGGDRPVGGRQRLPGQAVLRRRAAGARATRSCAPASCCERSSAPRRASAPCCASTPDAADGLRPAGHRHLRQRRGRAWSSACPLRSWSAAPARELLPDLARYWTRGTSRRGRVTLPDVEIGGPRSTRPPCACSARSPRRRTRPSRCAT